MEQWEHKVLVYRLSKFNTDLPDYVEVEQELNKYGQDGWRLVNCVAPGRRQGQSSEFVAVLARRTTDTVPADDAGMDG